MGNRMSYTSNMTYQPVSTTVVDLDKQQQQRQKLDEGHIFYRKQMSIFLIILSICLVSLSFCIKYGDEDEKGEYLISFIILSCFYFVLQFLLFTTMVKCPEENKAGIGLLAVAIVCTIIGLILASIAKYRMDNDEEEEGIVAATITFTFLSFIFSLIFMCMLLAKKRKKNL